MVAVPITDNPDAACCVQTCDVVTARAVAEMPTLAELCLPFVRTGGRLVVAKGATPQVSRCA